MKRPRNRTLPLKFAPQAKLVCLEYPNATHRPYALEYCGPHWENLLFDFFYNNKEIREHLYDIPDIDVGFTNDAIRISFKYDTPNEVIEEICNRAIQMMQIATQPIFKVGQSALFKTTQSDLLQYNDREVIVKRVLTEDECDIDEVGFMYEVTTNGETLQAFEDELS